MFGFSDKSWDVFVIKLVVQTSP